MFSIQKIGVLGRTYRHLNRYRQILGILIKYGLDNLVERLSSDQYIETMLKMVPSKRRERLETLSTAQRTRMAFEEMGPTFIKFGQILSTHPGFIPVEFIDELSKLQDEVPPFPYVEVKRIIEAELGAPPSELYEYIDETPLASASIGQVHRAALKGEGEVAVKIKRPDIDKKIEVDLEIMLHLSTLMERNIEEIAALRPVKLVEEFARTIEKEIDYTIESTNMERFSRQYMDDPTVYVPKIYRDTSTASVLTMEFIDGIKVSQIDKLDDSGLDRKEITRRGVDLILKMIFDNGFFHADPHPGNIFVLPENIICLVDFGMVGSVDRYTREVFIDLVDSIVNRNPSVATKVLLKLTTYDEEPDIRTLEKGIGDFMGQHLYKPLKDIEIGKLLQGLLELAFRFRLRILPDIFLMIKALGTVEGIACQLDPEFDLIAAATPFIKRIKINRFHPKRIAEDVVGIAIDHRQFIQQFPNDLLKITELIKQQRINFKIEHNGLDRILATFDQISNRISFSIIIAALLIGSALIVISDVPPLIFETSLIGILGFFMAAIMGIWLLVAILKKGRL